MTSTSLRGPLPQQILRFAGAGAVATVLNLVFFAALARSGVATQVANGVSLVISTIVNTAINRRWTFQITGQERIVVQQGQVLAILGVTWVVAAVALALLGNLVPSAGVAQQTAVVALANALSTGFRFVAMRQWIFRRPLR